MENNQSTPKNPNWGGARSNAGRKKKYGEVTKVFTIRIPVSKIQAVKDAIKYILDQKSETFD
jgi:hypothetical protein